MEDLRLRYIYGTKTLVNLWQHYLGILALLIVLVGTLKTLSCWLLQVMMVRSGYGAWASLSAKITIATALYTTQIRAVEMVLERVESSCDHNRSVIQNLCK